ncbi:MAG: hypothetical protein R2755_12530 [Acidimicrobiales bacterium]
MAPARTAASWAPALIMAGAVTQYLGAALAVHAFATLGAAAVAWLRVAWSAALLLAWRRPRRRAFDRSRLRTLAAFGTALAVMNLAFYLAIDRLPLGTAVAIEFSGPISVAALGSRRRRDLLAVVLAGAGVVLLADVQWQANALGVLFALGAAAMWAGYIVWGRRWAPAVRWPASTAWRWPRSSARWSSPRWASPGWRGSTVPPTGRRRRWARRWPRWRCASWWHCARTSCPTPWTRWCWRTCPPPSSPRCRRCCR